MICGYPDWYLVFGAIVMVIVVAILAVSTWRNGR
jgi:hypothetical protein